MDRRFFLQVSAMAAASGLAGWRFAGAAPLGDPSAGYDAVVVGAGLGGLCCAAHLARNGFKTLLVEQYDVPGGYATSFVRGADRGDKGDFTCEVSLHSSGLGSPGMRGMFEDLGVWDQLTLVEHPHAWSSRFPGFSLDVPAKRGPGWLRGPALGALSEGSHGAGRLFRHVARGHAGDARAGQRAPGRPKIPISRAVQNSLGHPGQDRGPAGGRPRA